MSLTPEFLYLNPKYLAFSFVKFEIFYPDIHLEYNNILDGIKQYFNIFFKNENSNKFNKINKYELLNYIDEYVFEIINNSSINIDYSCNLIRYNKKYILSIIEKFKDKNYSEHKLTEIFWCIHKSIIDIDLLKEFIKLGLPYEAIPRKFNENTEIISEYLALGDISIFKYASENVLLYKYNNSTILDNMINSNIIPSFITINSLETLKILEKHNRYDLFYKADLKLLMDYPSKEKNYMSKLIELYKNGINVNLEGRSYKYDNKEIMSRCYIEMYKNGLGGFLDKLKEEDLLEKKDDYNLLYYLIEYDKDITINKMMYDVLIFRKLKSNPRIQVELKMLGVDDSLFPLASIEYEEYECDEFYRRIYNQEYSNEFSSPVLELLEELRQLFLNDGKSNNDIVEGLIISYRYLTSINPIFIEEVKKIIQIKKEHKDFYYLREYGKAHFSKKKGVTVENNTISVLNHETGHALHHYLTNYEIPNNYNEIISRILNNSNFIQKVIDYSEKFQKINLSVHQKALELVDKHIKTQKLNREKLTEILSKEKEDLIKHYLDKGYTQETLEIILSDIYTVEDFLEQKRQIQIEEVYNLIMRYDYGAFVAIGDIIDSITGGKFRSNLLKDENNEIIPSAYGHGIRYYSSKIDQNHFKFTENIANYSVIIKSKKKDETLLLLRSIVGDELVDVLDGFYKNKILKLDTQEKTR